jgi:hypothetical protein
MKIARASNSILTQLTFLVLSFHTAVTIPGPGLHLLAGCGHATFVDTGEHIDPGGFPGDSSESCPVCHYVTQAQISLACLPVSKEVTITRLTWDVRLSSPLIEADRSGFPRAPPSV